MSNVVFELFAKLGLDSSEYEKGLGDAKSKASSIGGAIGKGLKTVAKVGAAALGAASAAVGTFATTTVKAGQNFDKSMSQVAATMGLTMDEMQNQVGTVDLAWGTFSGNLREYAQEMGKSTAFSATECADALNFMALAGYDAQTSMQMLPNVLNLAAAGSMDLARASDMVTDTQTAFGISLERTSQMVDEMAKAASTGNTSVEQLGDAFLVVGGLAQEMNGGMVELSDGTTATYDNIQELEIALTAMANAGIKGSEAGTHMRNMLLKLASPTKEGIETFENLGVSVFDSEGKMRSLAYIMEDLDVALGELTQEEKLQAISDIFNTRDTAAAEALLNAVGDDWASIAESILDADGAAQQMADTQLDNLAGDVTLFKSALEGAQIAISDVLTPSLRDFVQFGTDGLSKITQAFQEGGLTGAMDAFGTILSDGLAMILEKVPQFINAGMQLLSALGKGLTDNIDVILFAVGDVAEMLLNGLLTATRNGGSKIAEIIDWIVGVFQENYTQLIDVGMEIIANIVGGIGNALPTIIPAIVDLVITIAEKLIDNIPLLIHAAIQLIEGLANGLIQALPVLISRLPEIVKSIVKALVKSIPLLVNGALQLVQGVIAALPTIIQALVTMIPELIQAYVDAVINYLPVLLEGLVTLITSLVEALPQIIQILVEALPTIIQAITEALLANLPQLIEAMIQITIALVAALPQIISALIEAIPQIWSMIIEALITTAPLLFDAIVSILGTVGQTLLEQGATFLAYVGEVMSNIITSIGEWLAQLPTTLAYWAGYAIGQFIKFFIELPGKIKTWLDTTIANIKAFGENMKNDAVNTGKNFFNGLVDNIKTLPNKLMQLGAQLVNAISNLPSKFMEIGKNIVTGLWNGISGGWSWLTGKVSDLADSLFQGAKDALGIESPSKKFRWIGEMVDEGFAKGIMDNMGMVDSAFDSLANYDAIALAPATTTATSNTTSTMQNDIIRLLQEIVEKDIKVVLEGDADRLFRVMQSESARNKQITGQNAFA